MQEGFAPGNAYSRIFVEIDAIQSCRPELLTESWDLITAIRTLEITFPRYKKPKGINRYVHAHSVGGCW